jgi:hypothetical protein
MRPDVSPRAPARPTYARERGIIEFARRFRDALIANPQAARHFLQRADILDGPSALARVARQDVEKEAGEP